MPCAKCLNTFDASTLTLSENGEWTCRSCLARKQAVATTMLHEEVKASKARRPFYVLAGIVLLILLGILKVLLIIGEGFGRAL
jgi:hypothetical protein